MHMNNPMAGQTKNVQNYISSAYPGRYALVTKEVIIRGDEQNRHLILILLKSIIALCFQNSILPLTNHICILIVPERKSEVYRICK